MEKFKYYLCIILWTFMPKSCLAVDLELSDAIREAREANMKVADKAQIQENVQQLRNDYAKQLKQEGEQSACEKLNPKEILDNKKM